MTREEIIAKLQAHRTVGTAPPEELAWVAAHCEVREIPAGDVLSSQTDITEGLQIIVSGHLAIRVDRGQGAKKVMEWHAGDVSGLLPFSRMKGSPGPVVADEPSLSLMVGREHFPEMIRECPELTAILVHRMLDRARVFASSDSHDEKMKSLGKLAAGLAHELNNPASAVVRSAKALSEGLETVASASRALAAAGLTPVQLEALDGARRACLARRSSGAHSPLDEADRLDAIAAWLQAHGADAGLAGPLADTAVTVSALEPLAGALDGEVLDAALRWLAHGCASRFLAREIETAASRIYELVASVKGFTQMDRETAARPLDVGQGLTDTLTVLRSKVKSKSATVDVDIDPELPRVEGFGGELNQVWVNLIDNALDAVPNGGHVAVSATRDGTSIVVRVVDDGPGIPDGARERIFDPFFTTKPVGEGTGLGLDIVRRLVRRHDGEIEVESRPGRTAFKVRLPAAAAL
jgi:signal transduction histidine kinase